MDHKTGQPGLYLHLGAHRTATSRFQAFLGDNAGRLADWGLRAVYPGRDGAKGGALRLKLPERRDFDRGDLSRFEAGFERQNRRHGFAQADTLLISEENFPGNMQSHHTRTLFPTARARLDYLCARLDKPVQGVLFVTRGYDGFYASSYRKRLELGRQPPFAELKPEILAMERGWHDVVADIQAGTGAARVVVARYEDLAPPLTLLRALAPWVPAAGWVLSDKRYNQSRAIDALCVEQNARRAKAGAPPLTETDVTPMFSEPEKQALQTRYAQDLDALRKMKGVTVLG